MNSMSHPPAPSPLKAVGSAERALREAPFAAGLSMAVTDRTGVLASSVHGLADVAAGRPVTADTLFEIGSVSKGFTCVLLLQAQDAGLIDLDQPVARYLPWFRVRSRFAPVTVRHLMTHTAGIIEGSDFSGKRRSRSGRCAKLRRRLHRGPGFTTPTSATRRWALSWKPSTSGPTTRFCESSCWLRWA